MRGSTVKVHAIVHIHIIIATIIWILMEERIIIIEGITMIIILGDTVIKNSR